MAGHVKQQRVTEWRLIDGGIFQGLPVQPGLAGFYAAHASDAFQELPPYEFKTDFPLTSCPVKKVTDKLDSFGKCRRGATARGRKRTSTSRVFDIQQDSETVPRNKRVSGGRGGALVAINEHKPKTNPRNVGET